MADPLFLAVGGFGVITVCLLAVWWLFRSPWVGGPGDHRTDRQTSTFRGDGF